MTAVFDVEALALDSEQNRRYITKEIGKLLSDIWRIKMLAEQEYGQEHQITRKLSRLHEDVQAMLNDREKKR